jgi:hypothetical protein
MDIGKSVGSHPSSKPEVRLGSFRAYNIMFGAMVIAILILLLKDLNRLPFPAAFALAGAGVILLRLWQLAASRYESIFILLAVKREALAEKSLDAALSASAKAIETGSHMTCMLVLMFLIAVGEMHTAIENR